MTVPSTITAILCLVFAMGALRETLSTDIAIPLQALVAFTLPHLMLCVMGIVFVVYQWRERHLA